MVEESLVIKATSVSRVVVVVWQAVTMVVQAVVIAVTVVPVPPIPKTALAVVKLVGEEVVGRIDRAKGEESLLLVMAVGR